MGVLDKLSKDGIVFDSKPDAIPYQYRISYRISLICLIIHLCCGRKGCSLIKMHTISSAVLNKKYYDVLNKYLLSNNSEIIIVRFDSALNRAINYAVYDEIIIQQGNGTYRLTNKGKELAKFIINQKDIFVNEIDILNNIGLKLTNEKLDDLKERWSYENVKDK